MTGRTEQRTKGTTVLATLEFLRETGGPELVSDVLAALTLEERSRIDEVELTSEIPYPLIVKIWTAADEILAAKEPDWIERSGAQSILSSGVQLYGGIVRKSSPIEFLTQRVSLFRLYYHPGNMEVIDSSGTGAMLRLLGFDPLTPLFCRRQTGGLREVVAMAGGAEIQCAHVRCALEGDAFCEWSLRWQTTEGPRLAVDAEAALVKARRQL